MYQPYPGSETQLPKPSACPRPPQWERRQGHSPPWNTVVGLTAPLAGPVKLWGLLVWLAGLVAVTFLWRPSSTAFFRQAPA